jgi:light-regulated signal transduction histidine kinase (bacteriophytochrome)
MMGNLVGNAWKFTARSPAARIEIGAVCGEDGRPVYCVRDNGAGFDMAHAAKMFEAFQRMHTVAEFEGTGIGLAIVHKIVLRHGGRIWAEAAVQRGACFYFTLGDAPS